MNVPIIDVSPLRSNEPAGWRHVMQQLLDAHTRVGFSILVNHGVEADIVDALFDASRSFHAWPLERKMAMRYRTTLRGYLPLNTSVLKASTLGAAKRPNHSDSFVVLGDLPESLLPDWKSSAMGGTQPWPEIAGFEHAARRYRRAMIELGDAILPCFAVMLGLPRDGLRDYFRVPNPILRLLHYPAVPHRGPDVFGSAPHTDYGCLTFVAQDDVGGLQVQSDRGEWFDVPVVKNSLVLNTGHVIARWSGGRIKPTPHRVLTPEAADRYSIAFFYDCGLETPLDLDAAPMSDSTSIYGRHLEAILRSNYAFVADEPARALPDAARC
ncbi:isopenicillin N synthase family oxygenase [Burkholderia dolosa]|uniref:isopenicillin N synthase family dioxygenase n=1 Tax=Burkholderia dolosa TaxID=152500 RepID=UPI001B940005|nr:isopenicillin N synthase family oxygenase [Burkholderia dolosa]MBR8316808.1 isopenicillin N synthase family oxygenase [Burkholderia dolosa]